MNSAHGVAIAAKSGMTPGTPGEILYEAVMATGGQSQALIGGLRTDQISVHG